MRFMLNPLLSWLTVQGLLPSEMPMPRASWKGHLRLSLVSCPVYLSPATTRTKPIRLHQVWVPRADMDRDQQVDDTEDDEPAQRHRQANPPRLSTELADDFEPEPSEA